MNRPISTRIRSISTRIRLVAAMLGCALAGVAAGTIANASASGSSVRSSSVRHHHAAGSGRHAGRLLRLARRTVDGSFVVATKHGFVTVTLARGSLVSQSGQQLTINEGTPKHTYKAGVSFTLPANTVVRNNGSRSMLGSLQANERVTLVEGPHRALLLAHTPAH